MKETNVIRDKSKAFAIRIVSLYKTLTIERREYILSKQILRSGTSIGANVAESVYAISRADFLSKLYIGPQGDLRDRVLARSPCGDRVHNL